MKVLKAAGSSEICISLFCPAGGEGGVQGRLEDHILDYPSAPTTIVGKLILKMILPLGTRVAIFSNFAYYDYLLRNQIIWANTLSKHCIVVWVTRPEHSKGAKDNVKRPQDPGARSRVPEGS